MTGLEYGGAQNGVGAGLDFEVELDFGIEGFNVIPCLQTKPTAPTPCKLRQNTKKNPTNIVAMSAQSHTYHCLCSQLLLASSTTLCSLSRRRTGEGLDSALILPLPPLAQSETTSTEDNSSTPAVPNSHDHSLLLNTITDRKPLVVRRSDGFETRYQIRCGRCRLVVGYHLDEAQFGGEAKTKRRENVCYILPGSLVLTSKMMEGEGVEGVEFAALHGDGN